MRTCWPRSAPRTGVTNIAVADERAAAQLGDIRFAGPDAATRIVEETSENAGVDVVLNALVGALGLKPTLAALHSGARLALANKESLVAGGPLVLKAAAPGQIVPVDSEHSALAQCLRSGAADEVARLVLTASGGPFRGWGAEALETVTPEQAGAHPTWSMGPMNTLNSASLVNKGLELIETHLLFGIDYDRIDVVVHPQSIVHSMVTFTDGSTIAQASPPDMKLPIALALGWPARVAGAAAACDFSTASTWEFEPLDAEVFPAVDLARHAGQAGGCMTAVYNAANEEAAEAFLNGRISFPAIVRTVAEVLRAGDQWAAEPATVEDVLDAQRWARDEGSVGRFTGGSPRPMMFGIGIALFALAILASVALHECGHMWVARATGMKVRRYFVGFGPTLWSTRRPNKLGDTEYGVKAIPLGGFCDIAGMTSVEELDARRVEVRDVQAEDVEARRGPVRRTGDELRHRPGDHLRHRHHLGTAQPARAHHRHRRSKPPVSHRKSPRARLGDCTGPGPARGTAGLKSGDTVVKVGDTPVTNFEEMAAAIRKLDGPVPRSSTSGTGNSVHHRRRRHRHATVRQVRQGFRQG